VTTCRCQFCARTLEPAQEFRYLVETETLDDPTHLARIRRLPAAADGRPLRVCAGCQAAIAARPPGGRPAPRSRSGLFTAVGVFSLGWFLTTLLASPRV